MRRGTKTGPHDLPEKREAKIAMGIRFENGSVARHEGIVSEEKARAILAILAKPDDVDWEE